MTLIMPLLSADVDSRCVGEEHLSVQQCTLMDAPVMPMYGRITGGLHAVESIARVIELTEERLILRADTCLVVDTRYEVSIQDDVAGRELSFQVVITYVEPEQTPGEWFVLCQPACGGARNAWSRDIRNLCQRLRVDRAMAQENRQPGGQLVRSLGHHSQSSSVCFGNARAVDDREAAYRLVYDAYFRKGLAEPADNGLFTNEFLLNPETVTFVGKVLGEVAMTVTSIADSVDQLPMDAVFEDCLAPLRKEGRRLAEFGMLAVNPAFFGAIAYTVHDPDKMVTVYSLFRIALQHAKFAKNYTDIVFAIPPKHQALYRFMGVNAISEVRYYSKYNTPAVAMRIDLLALNLRPHVREFLFGTPISTLNEIGQTEWSADALERIFGGVGATTAPLEL